MGMTNTNMDYAGECDPTNTATVSATTEAPAEVATITVSENTSEQLEATAENPNFVNEAEAEDLEVIKDISNFATGIVAWHTDICNQAVHAMNMPEVHPTEGTHVAIRISTQHEKLQDAEGMRYLAPSEIEAFKAGIRYVYDQFKELPFKFLPTDADGNVQPEYAKEEVTPDAKDTH